MIEQLKALGAPESETTRWRSEIAEQSAAETVELPEDCRGAIEVFLAVDTQWRCVFAGSRMVFIGLDYAGVRSALGLSRTRLPASGFADLQLMERAALRAMAERR